MNIFDLNDLALALVAKDFSPRDPQGRDLNSIKPNNGGPTKTSRALAIIHLAAHDAYAKVAGQLKPRLNPLPPVPDGIPKNDANGTNALLSAGFLVAERLYPDFVSFITSEATRLGLNNSTPAGQYGRQVAEAWLAARSNDNSNMSQTDTNYNPDPGHHRPDPTDPTQSTLGRNWGQVKPFVLTNVAQEAPLGPPPALNSADYAKSFDQVVVMGRDNTSQLDLDSRKRAVVGIFWGYDGSINLGTPPRLYNQFVRAIPELKTQTHPQQIKILTAINAAMADAGIAAWLWKYQYDFWRPVVGIREADPGWGPTGKGDGNTQRKEPGNPFWLPLGAPRDNPPVREMPLDVLRFNNFTPNFPAYPSGHSTFGSACFETAAALLGKRPEDIMVKFVSDEFNDITRDNNGIKRPKLEMQFTLRQAIADNEISRIYLGVHWDFDATGGRTVGEAIARKVAQSFRE